jgi:hypothetical protein
MPLVLGQPFLEVLTQEEIEIVPIAKITSNKMMNFFFIS